MSTKVIIEKHGDLALAKLLPILVHRAPNPSRQKKERDFSSVVNQALSEQTTQEETCLHADESEWHSVVSKREKRAALKEKKSTDKKQQQRAAGRSDEELCKHAQLAWSSSTVPAEGTNL